MGETGQDEEFLPDHEREPRLPPRRAHPGLPVELFPRVVRRVRATRGALARLALLSALPARPSVQRTRHGEAPAVARRAPPAPGCRTCPTMNSTPHRARIHPVPDGTARPLWSVMIPAYNCNPFLPATLESVLEQDPGLGAMQ